MAAINDLIDQIEDQGLRERIKAEVEKMNKQKKFGLVFEEHIPECTPLYDIPIKRGSTVALKSGDIKETYSVISINDDVASCRNKVSRETAEFSLDDLVSVAEFGEPIYPYLKPIDEVENAPDSDLWHTLIEADNYHALQLLEYLYAGKVDCIYIDPPYNTGARDWKYNNDYVDGNDNYRHSKWLSMMEKRLLLAKKLLNPKDSVLIVTIDEKEYLHLGCLLEDIFPESYIQMVSDVINPKGVARSGFRRNDEYIFFIMNGSCQPARLPLGNEWSSSANTSNSDFNPSVSNNPQWTSMMRRGSNSSREHSPGCYYPIYVDPESKQIKEIGAPIPNGNHNGPNIKGLIQILPIRTNGAEGCWQVSSNELKKRIEQGRVRLGKQTSYGFVVNYLPDGAYSELFTDNWSIDGKAEDGSLIAHRIGEVSELRVAPTQWKIASHNASENGSSYIAKILNDDRFSFPKSLYATHDAIRFFVANKPDALVLDFFAGSGTTLHAVNLLNAEDGGHRRCILVTNNEVSEAEAKSLTAQGYKPGDNEWEKLGIARYVTWPRTVCSIEGHDVNGNPLKGDYISNTEEPLHMADGFKANAKYFKLGFLNSTEVALGFRFKEMLPLIWMKAGAAGKCPVLENGEIPPYLILPENKFAVLTDENYFAMFREELQGKNEIDTVFLVTDYETNYRSMVKDLNAKKTYQLYRDYLDNFRINKGRRSK